MILFTPTLFIIYETCLPVQVLGYKVVASSSTAVKQDYNEYMWTMRREFDEPEPTVLVDRDNITNINKEALTLATMTSIKDEDNI